MKTTNSKISIIIPNFNKGNFIKETLDSLINQKYPFWEAIIVDDGSSDCSLEYISDYCNRDKRFKYFQRSQAPKGGSVCRNLGLDKSIGDFVIFLDSDDILLPFCVEKRVKFIQNHPTIDFAVFTTGTFYKTIGDSKSIWKPSRKNHLLKFLAHDLQWHTMSPIWRRDFLIQLNGFDEQFPRLQDVELHTRALLQNNVNYEIAYQYPADCFYRIDDERTHQSYFEALTKTQSGTMLFTNKFEKLVKSTKQKKSLRGTLFTFLTQLNYYKAMHRITIEEFDAIFIEVSSFLLKSKVFNLYENKLMKIYCSLYEKGCWKVKGFNYLMKYFFVL